METIVTKRAFIPAWSTNPIPNFTLSASGLIALADLSTIAQRTALNGGSSWLDSLLLAPGLHYEQAANELSRDTGGILLSAIEMKHDGKMLTYTINNQPVVNYIQRVARPGEVVTLDVGQIPSRAYRPRKRSSLGQHATVYGADLPDLGWLSHLLYLISPVLTCVAFTFIVLLEDWWALGFLLALMLSRLLNIWVIKQRSRSKKPDKTRDLHSHRLNQLTEYLVDLGGGTAVALRGMSDDLQAITATVWLRERTNIEGYLEACAKMLVYLVACFSGNCTQAGNLIMLALLLVTAGLLALSNAHAKSAKNNGLIIAPQNPSLSTKVPRAERGTRRRVGIPGQPPYPIRHHTTESWPGSSGASGMTNMDDWAEKGQVGNVVRGHAHPFDDRLEHN